MLTKNILIVGIAAVLLGIVVFGNTENNSITGEVTASQNHKLIVAANTIQTAAAPLFIAEEKGYFKEEGLSVEVVPFTTGRSAFEVMMADKADVSLNAEFPPLTAFLKGKESCMLAEVATQPYEIVARKDRISDFEKIHLEEKKIGVPFGTTGEVFLHSFLSLKQVNEAKIILVDLKPPYLTAALARGDIDAIAWAPPETHYAKLALTDNFISANSTGIYLDHFSVWTKKENIEKKVDEISRLLRGFKKADEFIKENPEETKQIISKRLSIKSEEMDHILMPRFNLANDNTLFHELESEANWLKANNKASQDLDLNTLKRLACPEVLKSIR